MIDERLSSAMAALLTGGSTPPTAAAAPPFHALQIIQNEMWNMNFVEEMLRYFLPPNLFVSNDNWSHFRPIEMSTAKFISRFS